MASSGQIPVFTLLSVLVLLCIQSRRLSCQENLSSLGGSSKGKNETLVEQTLEKVHDCRFHYAQLPESSTRLTVYHLVLGRKSSTTKLEDLTESSIKRVEAEADVSNGSLKLQLSRLNLDPQLPFIFFTNGFNHNGVLNGTWMDKVARVYLSRYLMAHHGGNDEWRLRVNVIFLNWHMEGLLANNIMAMLPVYYRTMANFDIVVGRFHDAIQQILNHLDELRSSLQLEGSLKESNKDYYCKFKFYGHSLGSHILANALNEVHRSRPDLIFDRIYGLDPAMPCFLNNQSGLTASRAAGVVREVVVIHSNAGILGTSSDRGQTEIVLNGGTFQPNCTLFDLRCHHARSTQIFGYIDDSCKMVAYKCNKHEQFKLGACETCDSPQAAYMLGANSSASLSRPNCILANLDEQNEDSELIESIASTEQVRQLADNSGEGNDLYNLERAVSVGRELAAKELDYLRNAKSEYHFVNTNPNFLENSHCLQHYQFRLLSLYGRADDQSTDVQCPLKFLHSDGINVRLYEEPSYTDAIPSKHKQQHALEFKVYAIVEDRLHTGLGTFEGKPKLFVRAVIDNIDLISLYNCLVNQQGGNQSSLTTREFVLDIAFMSHTNKNVRHAFSSVLCAKWPSGTNATTDDEPEAPGHLMLSLCRQNELANVSTGIDRLISQVKFENQFEHWHVALLNSLFSLFSGWEPL